MLTNGNRVENIHGESEEVHHNVSDMARNCFECNRKINIANRGTQCFFTI